MPSLAFSHAAISCKDPLAIERYYTRYFGFRRARVIPLGQDQIVFIKLLWDLESKDIRFPKMKFLSLCF